MNSMLLLFECITCSLTLSLEEINLIAGYWNFHVSDFLRLFMISFKYGLTSLGYTSIDSALLLSPLLSYSI